MAEFLNARSVGLPDLIPENELFDRFREGDSDALTALYRTHSAAVFRFAVYMTADTGRAEELTQEVFVWLIHHPRAFDPTRGELGAFLKGVARKLLQRHRRKERRWMSLDDAILQRPSATEFSVPAADLGGATDLSALKKAIFLLPERFREAVVLCDLEGKSYEEAAAFAGCAVGTIRSRLHRARHLLMRKFRPHKDEGRRT